MSVSVVCSSNSLFRGWFLFFCGICMGAADLIPGISGGTLAFIFGFYQPLLESLQTFNVAAFQDLLSGRWRSFSERVAWRFLLTLLAGILCAFICFANAFHYILSHELYRVYLYALFLGFILASFALCTRQIQVWNWKIILGMAVGIVTAFILTGSTLSPKSIEGLTVPVAIDLKMVPVNNYDPATHMLAGLDSKTLGGLLAQGIVDRSTLVYDSQHLLLGEVSTFITPYHVSFFNGWLILCGALAVCALLLPGISGSYILTLLGVYPTVIEALVDFLNGLGKGIFNIEAFAILWSLGLGIIAGAFGCARLLSALLRAYPQMSMAVLSGFMIGAIRSVWPFWTYEYALMPLKLHKGPQLIPQEPFLPSFEALFTWQVAFCTIIGFVFVYFLDSFVRKRRLS